MISSGKPLSFHGKVEAAHLEEPSHCADEQAEEEHTCTIQHALPCSLPESCEQVNGALDAGMLPARVLPPSTKPLSAYIGSSPTAMMTMATRRSVRLLGETSP